MAIITTFTSALTAFFFLLFLLHLRGSNSEIFVDSDYVEVALNLEFLETEFFLIGALGHGLDTVDPTLAGGGPPPTGGRMANLRFIRDIIEEFGYQEVGHLRAILSNVKGFPRPQLDISVGAFAAVINKAFNETLYPPFDPYLNDINYLIASYIIPYVGLTGYTGAAPMLETPTIKQLVAGLLGVESGQDAVIRTLLYQRLRQPVVPYRNQLGYFYTVEDFTNKISALRNGLGGEGLKDEGLMVPPSLGAEGKIAGNVLAGDVFSMCYHRTPREIFRIVYGTGNENVTGGFFPRGAYGKFANAFLKPY